MTNQNIGYMPRECKLRGSRERIVPLQADHDLERAVLGALLIDVEAIKRIADEVDPSVFHLPRHRVVHEAMLRLHRSGRSIDLLSLKQDLEPRDLLGCIGGPPFFAELAEQPTAAHLDTHVEFLMELHCRRERIRSMEDALSDAERGGDSAAIGSELIPGVGKTQLALAICAALTRGLKSPGTVPRRAENVLYMTGEDWIGDTLRPRLEALGADLDRVIVLDGRSDRRGRSEPVSLADLEPIERAFQQVGPALIVIDPLQAFLGAGIDMHRAGISSIHHPDG